jgi:hypothetical protein
LKKKCIRNFSYFKATISLNGTSVKVEKTVEAINHEIPNVKMY